MSHSFENRYSFLDRILHRLAFRTGRLQVDLAELEDRVFSERIEPVELEHPLFVTGLPRAGTTLLLDLLVGTGEFASHTYRDMPFVLTPLLWSGFSRRFQAAGVEQERAHGDGMRVGPDSPEAFEEVLWKAHWKEHYRRDRIAPWAEGAKRAAFRQFFMRHLRKIVALRRATIPSAERYVSKNNLNIARLGYLRRILPDAMFLVPFRDPFQQAASLLRQHLNFLEIHRRDPFARDYMAGIGHFDFGENLRPVDFGGWLDHAEYRDPTTLGFWLEYWSAAYSELLGHAGPRVRLISYEALCSEPADQLALLADAAGLDDARSRTLMAQSTRVGHPRRVEIDPMDASRPLRRRVDRLHGQLKEEEARQAA